MGGSFGGYMANWVAGKTDRFRCIVTHASLWDLRPFHGTTDTGVGVGARDGRPVPAARACYDRQSPAANIAAIKTPMLVIHGEQDFRVPVSEALKLWTDLQRHGVRPGSSTSRTRTTGSSSRRTRASGTRRSWRSSTSTSWARSGSGRRCCRASGLRPRPIGGAATSDAEDGRSVPKLAPGRIVVANSEFISQSDPGPAHTRARP
jgi:hypothetical protein